MPLPRLTILERLPKVKLPQLNLGRRTRLAVKIGGYVLLGFIAFLFALQMTFPYDRVKDKFVEALSGTYDVTVGDVSRGIMPGTFTMTKVTLMSRPSKPDEAPQMTRFDEIEVDFGVLSLLRGAGTADFEVAIGRCHEEATVPYLPFVEALSSWLVQSDASSEQVLGDDLRLLRQLLEPYRIGRRHLVVPLQEAQQRPLPAQSLARHTHRPREIRGHTTANPRA